MCSIDIIDRSIDIAAWLARRGAKGRASDAKRGDGPPAPLTLVENVPAALPLD
jgi:hypothetical protein